MIVDAGSFKEHVELFKDFSADRIKQLVDGEGRAVDAEDLASRIRFNTDFAHKLADEIKPGTTVIVTDQPAVRNSIPDSTYFAAK